MFWLRRKAVSERLLFICASLLVASVWFPVVSPGAVNGDVSGTRRVDEVDVQMLLNLAEQGDSRAAYLLGTRYASGRGGTRDDSQALRWFKVSAELGLAQAQYNLGIMYAGGRGGPKDMRSAAYWFRQAAEQGLAEAQYNLGTLYATGNGLEVDFSTAVILLGKAAEHGVAGAQYNLGLMYEYGKGTRRDLERSLKWYRLAESQGFHGAKERAEKLAPLFPGSHAMQEDATNREKPSLPPLLPQPSRQSMADWFWQQDRRQYTIQLLGSSAEEDVRSMIKQHNLEDKAAYFRIRRLGKPWYTVIYGLYPTYQEAEKARKSLSPVLQKSKPWSRRLSSLLEIVEP